MRQYIGARYVPKFMGTYDATQVYEALSVVDNGLGTSYISKIPTPAGTPLTDTDHWQLYGASSGAIIHLQDQIDEIHDELQTERVVVENDSATTTSAAEIINFAGQGVDDQRALVIHNYTDSTALRVDHVGEGVMMQFINAHNAIKRPDKAATFHGDAEYVRYMTQVDPDGDNNWSEEVLGILDKNCDIWRSGYDNTGDPTRNHTFHIGTNKLDGGTWAFNIEAYNTNNSFMVFSNGGQTMLQILKNGANGFTLKQGANTSNAVFGDTNANITCQPSGVQINLGTGNDLYINKSGQYAYIDWDNNICTSSTRPTTGLHNGMIYRESDTHKLIWYLNGTWYDAMGNPV